MYTYIVIGGNRYSSNYYLAAGMAGMIKKSKLSEAVTYEVHKNRISKWGHSKKNM